MLFLILFHSTPLVFDVTKHYIQSYENEDDDVAIEEGDGGSSSLGEGHGSREQKEGYSFIRKRAQGTFASYGITTVRFQLIRRCFLIVYSSYCIYYCRICTQNTM